MKRLICAVAGFILCISMDARSDESSWQECDWRKSCIVQALHAAYKDDPISMFELRRVQGAEPTRLFQDLRSELLAVSPRRAAKFFKYAVSLEEPALIEAIISDKEFGVRAKQRNNSYAREYGYLLQKHIELTGRSSNFRDFVLFAAIRELRDKTWYDLDDDDLGDVADDVIDDGRSPTVFASRIASVGAWDQFVEWFHSSDIDWSGPASASADRQDFARASFLLGLAPANNRDLAVEQIARKIYQSGGDLVCFDEGEYEDFLDDGVWPDFRIARPSCPEFVIRSTDSILTALKVLIFAYETTKSSGERDRLKSLMFDAVREHVEDQSQFKIAVDKIIQTVPGVAEELKRFVAASEFDMDVKNYLTLRVSVLLRDESVIGKIRKAQSGLSNQRQINLLGNMLLGSTQPSAETSLEADVDFFEAVFSEREYSQRTLGRALGSYLVQAARVGDTERSQAIYQLG